MNEIVIIPLADERGVCR